MKLFDASQVASTVPYDNEVSELEATNVQDALDEVVKEMSIPRVNTVVRKITILADSALKIFDDFGHMRIISPESNSAVQGMLINKNILINSDASMSIESTAAVQILGV